MIPSTVAPFQAGFAPLTRPFDPLRYSDCRTKNRRHHFDNCKAGKALGLRISPSFLNIHAVDVAPAMEVTVLLQGRNSIEYKLKLRHASH